MDKDTQNKLNTLAPKLNQLPLVQGAECFYEVLSGGLLWRDEIPELAALPTGTFEALRGVIHYRTTLILGEPEEQYQACWSEAQRLFPKWPGFVVARRSVELRPMCVELKKAAVKEMDKMFDPL